MTRGYRGAAVLAVAAMGLAAVATEMLDYDRERARALTLEAVALLGEPLVTAVEVYDVATGAGRIPDTDAADRAVLETGESLAAIVATCSGAPEGNDEKAVRFAATCGDSIEAFFGELRRGFDLTPRERELIARSSRRIERMREILRDVALRFTVSERPQG